MTPLHRQSEVTVLERGPLLVVRVTGDIALGNSAAIGGAILSAWDESDPPHAVIVDLGDVPHMDSSGVGTLLQLRSRAKNSDVPLILCGPQRSPRRLLERTGVAGLFQIWPTVEEAMLGMPT